MLEIRIADVFRPVILRSTYAHRKCQEVKRSVTEINLAIAEQLNLSIGEDRFDMWFGKQDSLQLRDDGFTVRLDDDLSLAFVKQHFGESIARAVGAVGAAGGGTIPIRYEVRERQPVLRQAGLFSEAQLADAGIDAKNASALAGPSQGPRRRRQPRRDASAANGNGCNGHRALREANDAGTLLSANHQSALPFSNEHNKRLGSFHFGSGNALLKTTVEQVILYPGRFTPLVMHGPVGCGKSHLAHCIVEEARRQGGNRRCLLQTSVQFTTGFIEGLQGKGLPAFRNRYRQIDLLVIDDLQFLAGKKATLIEFQNTVEALLRAGKQIVVTADRPLLDLEFLGDSLITRLSSGINCPIEWPDLEARRSIARDYVATRQFEVSEATLDHVCTRMGRDVRALHGALNRLHAVTLACREPVDVAAANEHLGDLFRSQSPQVSMERIEKVVCDVCGVTPGELRGAKRVKRVSTARMLAIWLSRQHTTAGLSEIGDYFGGRKHSTVVAARKKVEALRDNDAEVEIRTRRATVASVLRQMENSLRVG